ncbi:MAG: FmdB family zinc ribbon protein [Armatimonadota bacterium]
MPTYVYRCKKCGHQFEIVQKMKDKPLTECPKCKGEIARLLFPVGIVFKGPGFHVNDYPSPGARATTTAGMSKSKPSPKTDKETTTAAKG